MKTKYPSLVLLLVMLSNLLVSCTGTQTISTTRLATPPIEEPASPAEEGIALTPTALDPIINPESVTQTSEPISTGEADTTDDLAPTETPEITDQVLPTEELIETDESVDIEEPVEVEDLLSIKPADGFHTVSSSDGQIATAIPQDWATNDINVDLKLNFKDTEATGESLIATEFISPNHDAYIYLFSYQNYQIPSWSPDSARESILYFLNKAFAYERRDVVILNSQTMDDGSERLTWSSESCNCTGLMAYKYGPPIDYTTDRSEKLWMLNILTVQANQHPYNDVFNYVLGVLTFPPEESLLSP